ncbi:hypothetical protein P8452_59720 [Trifolium repens]|nr:hypothetical protein P8452_59720 [Trifolium repens]
MREKDEREGPRENGKRKGYWKMVDHISTSFFFTNFPEELVWGDLWKLFSKYGSVCDVFIPKKVDKWGRKFGFVKFKEVLDVEALSKNLEDVWWEKFKLKVNKARFEKGDIRVKDSAEENPSQRPLPGNNLLVSDTVSFKQLLLGKGDNSKGDVETQGEGGRKKYRVASMADVRPLEIHVQDNTVRLLNQSRVGFFRETMDFQTFYDRLIMEGQNEVKATYMGGNMVLLQCSCERELLEVMKFNKQWWDCCFSKISPWKPRFVSECREIWIQIYGIPLHAWEEGTFKMVAGRFGVFVDFDEDTVAKLRMDVARVKLRTVRRETIDTVVQLKIQGELFDVWVVEERCRCGEERWVAAGEEDRSGGKPMHNSGEGAWREADGDLFSDGKTESESSETYQALLGLEQKGGKQVTEVVGTKEGIGNVDLPSQNFSELMVGEKKSGGLMTANHVEGEREGDTQIPICDGVCGKYAILCSDVGPTNENSNCSLHEEVGLSGEKQQECGACEGVMVGPDVLEDKGVTGPIGPQPVSWNPFVDQVDQKVQEIHQAQLTCVENMDQVVQAESELEADDVEGNEVEGNDVADLEDREEGFVEPYGVKGVTRISQLSESSIDSVEENEMLLPRKIVKKGNHSSVRPIPPQLGVPKFCQLAAALKSTGRRRKHKEGDPPSTVAQLSSQPNHVSGEFQDFDLHVVLPLPSSGIHLVVNNDGDPVPETPPELGGEVERYEEEANTLIDIQKKVGFTFEGEEGEIQNKLIELAKIDHDQKIVREHEAGYQ